MKKGLPSVFANRRVGIINNNEEPEVYKEEKKTELAVKEEKSDIKVKETVQKLPKTGM